MAGVGEADADAEGAGAPASFAGFGGGAFCAFSSAISWACAATASSSAPSCFGVARTVPSMRLPRAVKSTGSMSLSSFLPKIAPTSPRWTCVTALIDFVR